MYHFIDSLELLYRLQANSPSIAQPQVKKKAELHAHSECGKCVSPGASGANLAISFVGVYIFSTAMQHCICNMRCCKI